MKNLLEIINKDIEKIFSGILKNRKRYIFALDV